MVVVVVGEMGVGSSEHVQKKTGVFGSKYVIIIIVFSARSEENWCIWK